MCTFESQRHLLFEGLEVVRCVGLDLTTHPLAGPLLEPVELFIHDHGHCVRLLA